MSATEPVEPAAPQPVPGRSAANVQPQGCACGGGEPASDAGNGFKGYVYAIGRLRTQFPNTSVSQEFNQASGRLQTVVPDSWLKAAVLTQGRNAYLARDTCWVLQVPGPEAAGVSGDPSQAVDAYIIRPRSYVELNALTEALMPQPGQIVYVVAIGARGPLAPPEACNGLQLPILIANQIFVFTETDFINNVVASTAIPAQSVASTFAKFMSVGDNAGATSEHRALNYLVLRYPNLYTIADSMLNGSSGANTFASISARRAEVQGTREIVEIVLHFVNRVTQIPTFWACKVDTTGQFPFMVAPLQPFYPHP